jgi:hypothetical protein
MLFIRGEGILPNEYGEEETVSAFQDGKEAEGVKYLVCLESTEPTSMLGSTTTLRIMNKPRGKSTMSRRV